MMEKEMTMVERVAKAIYDVTSVDDMTLPWEKAKAGQKELHMEWARAAIEAMREPTEAMLWEGPGDPYMEKHVWARMIGAALKENEG
jgi:hypothetical protein